MSRHLLRRSRRTVGTARTDPVTTRYPGTVRSRWGRTRRVVGVGVAFALVFAPGEALGASHAEPGGVSAGAIAVAVLAPTFVSTPLMLPDPPLALDEGADSSHGTEGVPLSVVLAILPLIAAGLLARVYRAPGPVSSVRDGQRSWASRLRAPPFSVATASA